ncbi:MAG TPA: DUF434 domain-containing protein [Acidobacteriota bacterium]|nr:DUF434 domain-containing protein [Acidobacteriota bacterium]
MSPDNRTHRGAHPEDHTLFAPDQLERLRLATLELSWLLSRGYQLNSSLKLVGDRHSLRERQRLALSRTACPDHLLQLRDAKQIPLEAVHNQVIVIDGFNLIITLEAALSRGVLLLCQDGCIRDLSSVHGSYRSVIETESAIAIVGQMLALVQPAQVIWYLDKPISNSGRLAQKIRTTAEENAWNWEVEVVFNPDRMIIESGTIALSSDSLVLDGSFRWVNFVSAWIAQHHPDTWIVNLRNEELRMKN